jgi:hypothetical protein
MLLARDRGRGGERGRTRGLKSSALRKTVAVIGSDVK